MADNMLIDGLIKFCDEKSKNIKLKAEPQVFVEIKQALEELKAIKQWKSDVMEGFCKYDASSFEEIVVNARAKAIDELKNKVCMHFADWKYSEDDKRIKDIIELASESVEEIVEQMKAEQMKAGGENE